jgi:hypothetical protein
MLEGSDTSLDTSSFHESSIDWRSDPLTIYLIYKWALRNNDDDLGKHLYTYTSTPATNTDSDKDCLEMLSKLGPEGITYILACISEAQRRGNARKVTRALQNLLKGLVCSPRSEPSDIQIAALLR